MPTRACRVVQEFQPLQQRFRIGVLDVGVQSQGQPCPTARAARAVCSSAIRSSASSARSSPKVLGELAAGNRNSNGFTERFSLCGAGRPDKAKWNSERKSPSFDIVSAWREVVGRLTRIVPAADSGGTYCRRCAVLAGRAPNAYILGRMNLPSGATPRGDTLTAIASKLEIYARFCLLLALSDWACGAKKKAIEAATVEGGNPSDGVFPGNGDKGAGHHRRDALTDVQLAVMSELPATFTTAEGVAIAGKCGMAERTFKKFLRDRRGVFFTP